VAVHTCPVVPLGTAANRKVEIAPAYLACHPARPLLLPSFLLFHPSRSSAFVSAIMAPQLNAVQHILINTLLKEGFDTKLIASEASCSARAVQRIRLKREQSEMPTPRTKRVGRRSCITSPMKKAFFDTLTEQPYLYRCEMADFFYRRFRKKISERSISRILRSTGWTRTTIHRIAQQRNADLRDHYLHRISQYKSYQLIFVDESGCDGRAGHRRWGWSPKGSSPVQVTKFSRRKRWHILLAYAQDGIMLKRVY
jgi:hypothetical protein